MTDTATATEPTKRRGRGTTASPVAPVPDPTPPARDTATNPNLREALGLVTDLAQTPFFRTGVATARGAIISNGIAAFDGEPGTGKTTCATFVSKTAGRPSAIATMPHRPAPLDVLRHAYKAITQLEPSGTRWEMQNDLLQVLDGWPGVLIIDELQNTQADAMQELVWLYENSAHSFALVVVGTGVLSAVGRYPQLESRIMGKARFAPLQGEALIDAVRSLDPRLAQAKTVDLAEHDQSGCRGLLRRWVQTVTWLNAYQHDGPADADILADIRTQFI